MSRKSRRILDNVSDTTTLLGQGSSFSGDFAGTGSFIVGGEVIGDCDLDGTLTLAPEGLWKGNIRARDVIVGGVVEGEVIAEGKLEIANTARVTGSLTGAEIAVAEGAIIDGGMHVTGGERVTRYKEKRDD